MVCCGYIICWTPNEVTFFLANFVGYNIDFSGWFYHFIFDLEGPSFPAATPSDVLLAVLVFCYDIYFVDT